MDIHCDDWGDDIKRAFSPQNDSIAIECILSYSTCENSFKKTSIQPRVLLQYICF